MDIEKPKVDNTRLAMAKILVYGIVFLLMCLGVFILYVANFGINIVVDASVSLTGPLQVLVWFIVGFVILVLLGSYAQVFGVKFLNSIGSVILDMLDKYERR